MKKMKKLFSLLMLAGFIMAACSPAPTSPGAVLGTDLPGAAVSAQTMLAQQLGVDVQSVRVLQVEEVEWPDACLGIQNEGQACAQVITPGFRIMLEANNQQFEFRSNQDGSVVLEVPPAV